MGREILLDGYHCIVFPIFKSMSTVRAAPERLGAGIGMAGEQDILARLEALNISFDKVQHGPVMTCDAQVGSMPVSSCSGSARACSSGACVSRCRGLHSTYPLIPFTQAAALGPVEGSILKNLLLKVYGFRFRIWASMAMRVVVARQTGPCTGGPWGAVLGSYPQHVSPSCQFGFSSWQPPP